jgi:biotin operon repressor
MIRRYVLLWLTCRDASRPSGRDWARQLGISHTWLQKLVREFRRDPNKVRRIEAYGYPTLEQLGRAQEHTRKMRERGELRLQGERTAHG